MRSSCRAAGPVLVALLLCLFAPASGSADTVVLKNGSAFDGQIVEETAAAVVLRTPDGTMTFRRDQVARLVRGGKKPAPPPDPKPTPPADPGKTAPPADPGQTAPPKPAAGPAAAPAAPGATAAELAGLPQSPPISLNAADVPLDEVLKDLSRQAGVSVGWGGHFAKPPAVTLALAQVPFWEALLTLCRHAGGPFEMSQGQKHMIELGGHPGAVPSGQVLGPVLLASFGVLNQSFYDDAKKQWLHKDALRLVLLLDPRSTLRIVEPRLDPDFRFTPEGGSPVTLKADKELQNAMGQFEVPGREWSFLPRAELAGKKADATVRIPLHWATALQKARLKCAGGEASSGGDLELRLEAVKSDRTKVSDPGGAAYDVDADRFTATFQVIHAQGILFAAIRKEKRVPTKEEAARLVGFPECALVTAHQAHFVGEDGSTLSATLRSAEGMSSPWDGYRFEAVATQVEPGFHPKEVVIECATGYRAFAVELALTDVPLPQSR